MEDMIKKFGKNAKELAYATELGYVRNASLKEILSLYNDDSKSIEIFRSLEFKKDKILFPLDIEFPGHSAINHRTGLKASLHVASIVNKLYPEQFLFTLSGRGVHAITVMPQDALTVKQMKILASSIGYSTSYNEFLCKNVYKNNSVIRSVGSYNKNAELFDIVINPDWDVDKVIKQSKKMKSLDFDFVEMDEDMMPDNMSVKHNSVRRVTPPVDEIPEIDIRWIPPCVRLFFSKDVRKSHQLSFLTVLYFYKIPAKFKDGNLRFVSESELYNILKNAMPTGNKDESATFMHRSFEGMVDYVFNVRKYEAMFSCNTIKLLGYCCQECNRQSVFDT